VIDRPVAEVFAFISNFENMRKWNYFVVDATNESAPGLGIGTTYRQRRKSDEQRYMVTEFEPDLRVAVRTLSPAPNLHMRFRFEPYGRGTRLTDEWVLETGLPRWLQGIGAARISSAVRDNLAKLKELLETGRVRLQDGRVETVSPNTSSTSFT
jgi:polyketide cyclase/dehydrase/lipid transport protein